MIIIKRFYVYEWYIKETGEIFYVGKGTGNRRNETHNRNKYFNNVYNKYECRNRIVKDNITNEQACELEKKTIEYYWSIEEAKCNLTPGGTGFAEGSLNPIHDRVNSPGYINPFSVIKFEGEDNHFYGKKHSEETKRKISESRKGKGGRSGEDNPMYGKGFKGKDNPMYGKTGFKHPNSKMFRIVYDDGKEEFLTSKECEAKFGIAFNRVRKNGGVLHYKSNSKNKELYEGLEVKRVK